MKILAIRLKNLTSIEGVVEVDFTSEPLYSAGIFAISGPTGAGKSTLLDALCLALYDKAPRFASSVENVSLADVGDNQINQSDVRNLLRRGMSDGYAEVDFIGMDGHRYRSRWSVRRAKFKATGSLQSQVMEVKDLDTEKEFQGTKKELLAQLTELVGLTYEQFTRTVLLAQNDFATFLKSKGTAKAELLEKLTGTAVYSRISKEIFLRSKAMQEEVSLIQGQMNAIELMSDEEWILLKKEKADLFAKREAGVKMLTVLNNQLNVVRSLKVQEELYAQKEKEEQAEQGKLKGQSEQLVLQEETLRRFKEQCEAIQPDLRKARELDVQIQSNMQDFVQAQQSWKGAVAKVEEQEKKWKAANESSRSAYNAFVRLLNWSDAELPLQVEQVEEILRREEVALQQEEKVNEDCLQQLNAFEYPALMDEQSRCQKELERLQQVDELRKTQKQILKEIEGLEKNSADCSRQLAREQAALEVVKRLYEHARMAIGKDVKALRQQLHDGEACPVCGSTSHPYSQKLEAMDTVYQQMEHEYTVASETYQRLNNQSIALQSDLSHRRQLNEQQSGQMIVLLKEIAASTTLQTLFSSGVDSIQLSEGSSWDDWKQKLNSFALSQSFSFEVESEGGLSALFVDLKEMATRRIKELSGLIEQYVVLQKQWQQADVKIKSMRSRCDNLRKNVSLYHLALQKEISSREQVTLLQQSAASEKQRFDGIEQALTVLRKDRGALLKGKSVEDAERALDRREKELLLFIEQARNEVEATQRRLAGLAGEKKSILASMNEWREQYQKIDSPETLPASIEKQQAENIETEQTLSAVEVRLLQQQKNKEKMECVKKEMAERQGLAERWAKLNKLLGSADGAKFKVIAQSYTLNLLLLHANKHLEYLSKRYKLQQVPGTLALQVIDCDMCDEVRTVYSLSGGESFLISLALALGLSSLSSNNLKVDSLFIDEGFGSLDADSLRTAMEALEQLQMQGRKVGVISHVQEMSERISVQVQVHKKINGKSVLTVVG